MADKLFYDQGWEAKCLGQPFDPRATMSWMDGWKDCSGVSKKEQDEGLLVLKGIVTLGDCR